MPWIYSNQHSQSVIVMENRTIRLPDAGCYPLRLNSLIENPNKEFRNNLLPFIVNIDFNTWYTELVSGEIDDWIVEHLTRWWYPEGIAEYRFQKEEDAVQFKLVWG